MLQASDLGSGWTGPVPVNGPPALRVYGCDSSAFTPRTPIKPMANHAYSKNGSDGGLADSIVEGVYHFAPGAGPGLMTAVEAALKGGCGNSHDVHLIEGAAHAGDASIVYTGDGGATVNILVRAGDDVASAAVVSIPSGTPDVNWLNSIVRSMAARLTGS